MHLSDAFCYFSAMFRSLNRTQLTHGGVRGIRSFASSKNFPHLTRIKAQQRVLLELKALVNLILGEFRAHHTSSHSIRAVDSRDEWVVLCINSHCCWGVRLLRHVGIFFERILSNSWRICAILVVMITGSPWGLALKIGLTKNHGGATLLFKEAHLFFSSLLLGLVLIFYSLHLFFKFLLKLLNSRLFLAS